MARFYWFTSYQGATLAQLQVIVDRLKARFEATYPAASAMPWGILLPGRQNSGTADGGSSRVTSATHRAFVASRSWARSLGENLDMETANNQSTHQDPALGAQTLGERMAVGVAAHFTTGLNADGPVLAQARFTDASRTAIELSFTLVSGTALATADGSTNGLKGFAVAPAGTGQTAWDRTGFTAALTGPLTVTLTKTSGAWGTGSRVGFGNATPVTTGGVAARDADNAALLKMPGDNDNLFNGQPKYTARAGNMTRLATNIPVAEAN